MSARTFFKHWPAVCLECHAVRRQIRSFDSYCNDIKVFRVHDADGEAPEPKSFEQAVEYLVAEGIAREEAEQNLGALLSRPG